MDEVIEAENQDSEKSVGIAWFPEPLHRIPANDGKEVFHPKGFADDAIYGEACEDLGSLAPNAPP